MLNVVDGTFPSEFACGDERLIEEERRLLYVAVTRARSDLHLIHPQRFFVPHQPRYGGRHVYAAPSRFMTAELAALCEEQWFDDRPAAVADGAPGSGPTLDLPRQMRSLW